MFSRRILVDLEAILDTREGIVLDKYPHLHRKLDESAYRERVSEVIFSMIGIEDWDERWKNRDVSSLMQSKPTYLMYELMHVFLGEEIAHNAGSPNDKPTLTINTHPYKLTTEVKNELSSQLSEFYGGIKIEMGYWNFEVLSPTTLKGGWDAWYMYDWYGWLEVNAHKLENRIPTFVIYRPALLTGDMTTVTSKQLQEDAVNPFSESKKFLAEYVTTEILDAKTFCSAV